MRKIKSLVVGLALAVGVSGCEAKEIDIQISSKITNLMSSRYGDKNYINSKQCWLYNYEEKNDKGDMENITYCMKPKQFLTKQINSKSLTFILANSDDNKPKGSYMLTSGLMGLFVIDEKGKVISSNKKILTGFNGNTNSDNAKFEKIGKQQYGWIIDNGICPQGVCTENYEIYAPINSNIKLIAMIGKRFEDDQNTEYTLEFIDDDSTNYPIQIYKIHDKQKTIFKKLIFNKQKNIYTHQ